jgi:hypothetical protein
MDTARRTQERLVVLKNTGPAPISGDFATANTVSVSSPAQDIQRALEHYHTDALHYRDMVIRALTSLRTDLSQKQTMPENKSLAKPKTTEKPMEEFAERNATKKAKPKKGESFTAWPEQENDEEVETFNLSKKS